ncbi:MAG: hypothetical protein Q9195_008494 [Heterodermia aff. obscurata]
MSDGARVTPNSSAFTEHAIPSIFKARFSKHQHLVDNSGSDNEENLGIETPVSGCRATLCPAANSTRSRLKSQTSSLPTIASLPTPATEDVIIAFMGITGSGKSSFIKALTGCDDIVVGDGLKSSKPEAISDTVLRGTEIATAVVKSYQITIGSTNFVLVDTPGFNDTHRSDGDILKAIAGWLNSTYRQGAKLTGILYLHPIKDVRMEGSSLMNFRAFQRLCGENTFKHIVLCTTFWDLVSESTGAQREKELCENPEFWAKMKDQGSQVVRIKNYAQSKDVLLRMAGKSTVTLDIQKEMVEEKRSLDDTNVGRTINAQMAQMKAEHEAQLAKARLDAEILLKKRDEENRKRTEEQFKRHKSVRDAQERLLKEQQAEQARLKAQIEEDRRQAELRMAAEKTRLEEIQAENKRLAAEKQRILNEHASRAANEKRALAESHKRTMCKTYRAEFAGQTQALDRARNFRMVFAKLYGFHQQSPAFLRWCDRCFELVGFRAYYHSL